MPAISQYLQVSDSCFCVSNIQEPIEQIQTGTDTILAEMKQMKKTMQEMQEMMNKMAMELSMKTIQNDTIPRTS